ncbi:geraniol 8-hydroxylase-like [Magnolia sinica]|uniref:geraniol 8-hydroxylase-like n=1 Tax=Magnolia sinica TaxID=86752 RepID=UPI00265B32B1|nr:geraniol 8-hydroxylase-like [Magnolia sinica]
MDYSTMLPWTLIVLACIHVILLVRKRVSSNGKLPPGPIPLPIVGSLLKLGSKPNESFTELAKTYGPLMTLKLGSITTIVVSSSIMAKEVLQKNDQSFAGRVVVAALGGVRFYDSSSIVGSPPTTYWRKIRAICNTQMFTMARLAANQGLRRKKVQDLIAHMHEHSLSGRPIDIGQATFTTTLNLIFNTVFSVDLVDPNTDSVQEFKNLVWEIMKELGRPNLADFFPVLRVIDPQGIRRHTTAYFKKLYAIFDEMIAQRILSRSTSSDFPRRNDFLDVLLDQKDDRSFEFGDNDIKPVLADIFLAGSDTSSTAVEWAMAELLRNPDCMAKARLELMKTIGSGQQVEESDIARLPYLQAVVKETLRLHPPAPLFNRKTITDVEISGFAIPKNTWVTVNVWAIGRDPNIWKDPSSFLPERFLGSDIDFKGQDFEFIPFGSGRRICPGLPLAFRMVHLMLASLLHSFDWKLPNGMMSSDIDMNSKFGITMQLAAPLRAIPTIDG